MQIDLDVGYNGAMGTKQKSLNKMWTGAFTFLKRVTFSQRPGRWKADFTGAADVYSFRPDDPRCKVTYAALITGVSRTVMCSESGNVGAAVLRSAGLAQAAKNSGVAGEYDTFPEPIGCPAERLQADDGVQALTFYRKK